MVALLASGGDALASAPPGGELAMARVCVLAAHATASAAPSYAGQLSGPQAAQLRAGWAALLRDAADAARLAEPHPGAPRCCVTALQPPGRRAAVRALLLASGRAVLGALAALAATPGAASRGWALGDEDAGLMLSLALWAATPEAAVQAAEAVREGGAGALAWGVPARPQPPVGDGLAALALLLPPACPLGAETLAQALTAIALTLAQPGCLPQAAATLPRLVRAAAAATPAAVLLGPFGGAIARAVAATARAALTRLLALPAGAAAFADAAAAASASLAALGSLVGALPAGQPAAPLDGVGRAGLALAHAALAAPHPDAGLTQAGCALVGACAAACSRAQRDEAAAAANASVAALLAQGALAPGRLGSLLDGCASLGLALGAAEGSGIAARRCGDAIASLVDDEAAPPPFATAEALQALRRCCAAAAALPAGAPGRAWAAALAASTDEALLGAAARALKPKKKKAARDEQQAVLGAALGALAASLPLRPAHALAPLLARALPLATDAAQPEGAAPPEPQLVAAAAGLFNAAAAAAPEAFKQVMQDMEPAARARLQAAARAAAQATQPAAQAAAPAAAPAAAALAAAPKAAAGAAKPGAISLGAFAKPAKK